MLVLLLCLKVFNHKFDFFIRCRTIQNFSIIVSILIFLSFKEIAYFI